MKTFLCHLKTVQPHNVYEVQVLLIYLLRIFIINVKIDVLIVQIILLMTTQ